MIPQHDDAASEVVGTFTNPQNRNAKFVNKEKMQRQPIPGTGLWICLVFFLIINSSYATVLSELPHINSSKGLNQPFDSIHLSSRDLLGMKTVLLPLRTKHFTAQKASARFYGSWKTIVPENISVVNSTTTTNDIAQDGGPLIITLTSVPIEDLPDLSFVYGNFYKYDRYAMGAIRSVPLQGVVLTAEKKVLLFSTPYVTQILMVQYYLPPSSSNATSGQGPPAQQSLIRKGHFEHALSGDMSGGHVTAGLPSHYELITTASEGQTYRIRSTATAAEGDSISSPEIKVFLWDSALTPYNNSAWNVSDDSDNRVNNKNALIHTFALGEDLLSHIDFGWYQSPRSPAKPSTDSTPSVTPTAATASSYTMFQTTTSSPVTPTVQSGSSNQTRAARSSHSAVEFLARTEASVASQSQESLANDRLVSPAHLASDCLFALELSPRDEHQHGIIDNLHGVVHSFYACSQHTLSLSTVSDKRQLSELNTQVEIYSIVYTTICFVQLLGAAWQARFIASEPAQAMLTSIPAVLAQCAFDFIVFIGHSMLYEDSSSIFFKPFLLIWVLKWLLSFVIELSMLIDTCRGRFLWFASISCSAYPFRMVKIILLFSTFLNFVEYFARFFVFSLPVHPFHIILLYSFWWPQIIHNIVHNSKHVFHPFYVYGFSLTRLFLPLYLMGYPENFLVKLWQYNSVLGELSPSERSLLSPWACVFLVVWLAVQVGILQMQATWGPRWFVPKCLLPQPYNYHRVLPAKVLDRMSRSQRMEVSRLQALVGAYDGLGSVFASMASTLQSGVDSALRWFRRGNGSSSVTEEGSNLLEDVEIGPVYRGSNYGAGSSRGGLSVTETSTAVGANNHDDNSISLDCPICIEPILFPNRAVYMITPCDHVYHTECLTIWFRTKFECPACTVTCPAPLDHSPS